MIRRAWTSRDTAVQKKNIAEVELARERIEEMQVILFTIIFQYL